MNHQTLATFGIGAMLGSILVAFALGAFLPSQRQAPAGPATPASAKAIPSFSHIFIIVLENKDYRSVVGSNRAPYFNALAQRYASAQNFYGIRHPSLPNYIALTGGDTFGITSNCTDCFVNAPNLVDQLEAAGKTWKAYMESMPSPCFIGDAPPLYQQKHNPFIYYDNVRMNPARCAKIVPFSEFAADAQANRLPDFVWITPNMCNDMHDCPVSAGDAWLKTWVPTILESAAWKDNGVLFITFDEGVGNGGCCQYAAGGRIPTLVLSPLARPGYQSPIAYQHYSLLRTIESAWKLPLLGRANCDCSPPMADFFAASATQP